MRPTFKTKWSLKCQGEIEKKSFGEQINNLPQGREENKSRPGSSLPADTFFSCG